MGKRGRDRMRRKSVRVEVERMENKEERKTNRLLFVKKGEGGLDMGLEGIKLLGKGNALGKQKQLLLQTVVFQLHLSIFQL
ncbi:hypothetical protein, partial [Escherichia coli]|uniref:hypothetical protein n=1 Tax=Escherichia coli TaxID=562 RepID=UPI0011BA63C7